MNSSLLDFNPKDGNDFPDLADGFVAYLAKQYYDWDRLESSQNLHLAEVHRRSNSTTPKINISPLETAFENETKMRYRLICTFLIARIHNPIKFTLFGKARERYAYLESIARGFTDISKADKIDGCYEVLQRTMIYPEPLSSKWIKPTILCLRDGYGVCRHLAPLLSMMLKKSRINNFTAFGSELSRDLGHVWVRVDDKEVGKFDLDPSWYVNSVKLPLRKGIREKPWEKEAWTSEIYRLNER